MSDEDNIINMHKNKPPEQFVKALVAKAFESGVKPNEFISELQFHYVLFLYSNHTQKPSKISRIVGISVEDVNCFIHSDRFKKGLEKMATKT